MPLRSHPVANSPSPDMHSPPNPYGPSFDASVRIFSQLSLLGTVGVLLICFLRPERGIRVDTHLLLLFRCVTQLALLLLFSAIAIGLQLGGRLQCSRFTTRLSALAVVGLVAEFCTVLTVAMDREYFP